MSASRLLALALTMGCAAAAAQSSPRQPSPNTTSASQPLLTVPYAKANTARAGEFEFTFPPGSRPQALHPAPNDRTCYAIRSYRVRRDDPESDSTRPAGYSTCQPAGRFQMKETGDSLQIVPR